jgi:integrase
LLSLWNSAADDDLVPYPRMRRIRRAKVPELVVRCFTIAEVNRLIDAAGRLEGEYENGVTRRAYWRAAIMVAWDTGLRRGDVWRFRKSIVRDDGTLRVVQHNTKRVVAVRLRAGTVKALAEIQHDEALRWTWAETYFGRHFKRLVKAARVSDGTFKWLRRSSGSYVELQQAGAGSKHLGQTRPEVFTKHYDAKLGGHTLPMPPALSSK